MFADKKNNIIIGNQPLFAGLLGWNWICWPKSRIASKLYYKTHD